MRSPRVCLLAAAMTFVPAAAPAQQPANTAIVLLLRDPSGAPVHDADAVLLLEPARQLPSLATIAPDALVDGDVAPAAPTARSDARGVLRLLANGRARAGAALITTAQGLGALVPRVLPGDAQRVALAPLGEITTATGSEPFVLHVALTDLDGNRIVLPPQQGTAVRLPAGSYEAWAHNADGWTWQRLDVVAGRRALLQFTGPAQLLARAPGTSVRPVGWPTLELLGEGHERAVLLGAALAAPLLATRSPGGAVVVGQIPGPPRRAALVWPEPAAADEPVVLRFAEVTPDARVFVMRRRDGGDWLPRAAATADAEGRCHLPAVSGGDDWLLAIAPGAAPWATPWTGARAAAAPLALPRGLPLRVACRTTTGEPAIDVQLVFEPALGEVAALTARTDSRGHAEFGLVAAPGRVFVSDPRFANQHVDLALVPRDELQLELGVGAAITGRAVLAGGEPAVGVLVSLRDPSGRLRPAQRSVLSGDDGTFAFAGLDDTRRYVLFATMLQGGRTWSGKLADVATGGAAVELPLRDEDPKLTPDAGR